MLIYIKNIGLRGQNLVICVICDFETIYVLCFVFCSSKIEQIKYEGPLNTPLNRTHTVNM